MIAHRAQTQMTDFKAASANTPPLARPLMNPKISIVITNYNYARFVARAIDSALMQSPPVHEVIVVDDASTDGSREIIEAYRGRVKIVFQPQNGGQGAGFNAGYAEATGDLVGFLDADDFLLPGLVDRVASVYQPDISLYNFRMQYANEAGETSGSFPPSAIAMDSGALSKLVRTRGSYIGSVTSGMVYARFALEQIMPIPDQDFRINADGYLFVTAPLFGPVAGCDTFHAAYRIHGAQFTTAAQPLGTRARKRFAHDAMRYEIIRAHSARLGLPVVDDMADNDPFNLFERLVSITFEPEQHPVAADTPAKLITRLSELHKPILVTGLKTTGWHYKALLLALRLAPLPLRRVMMREMISMPLGRKLRGLISKR